MFPPAAVPWSLRGRLGPAEDATLHVNVEVPGGWWHPRVAVDTPNGLAVTLRAPTTSIHWSPWPWQRGEWLWQPIPSSETIAVWPSLWYPMEMGLLGRMSRLAPAMNGSPGLTFSWTCSASVAKTFHHSLKCCDLTVRPARSENGLWGEVISLPHIKDGDVCGLLLGCHRLHWHASSLQVCSSLTWLKMYLTGWETTAFQSAVWSLWTKHLIVCVATWSIAGACCGVFRATRTLPRWMSTAETNSGSPVILLWTGNLWASPADAISAEYGASMQATAPKIPTLSPEL